jgi:hypothetical protein
VEPEEDEVEVVLVEVVFVEVLGVETEAGVTVEVGTVSGGAPEVSADGVLLPPQPAITPAASTDAASAGSFGSRMRAAGT